MKRRAFISLLGTAAAVWPLAGRAQQPAKLPTVGALVLGSTDPEQFWRDFRQGLRELGYVEGQNIRFEFRSAQGQADRLPELAAELVRRKRAGVRARGTLVLASCSQGSPPCAPFVSPPSSSRASRARSSPSRGRSLRTAGTAARRLRPNISLELFAWPLSSHQVFKAS